MENSVFGKVPRWRAPRVESSIWGTIDPSAGCRKWGEMNSEQRSRREMAKLPLGFCSVATTSKPRIYWTRWDMGQ
jgi:hypothetical protein